MKDLDFAEEGSQLSPDSSGPERTWCRGIRKLPLRMGTEAEVREALVGTVEEGKRPSKEILKARGVIALPVRLAWSCEK